MLICYSFCLHYNLRLQVIFMILYLDSVPVYSYSQYFIQRTLSAVYGAYTNCLHIKRIAHGRNLYPFAFFQFSLVYVNYVYMKDHVFLRKIPARSSFQFEVCSIFAHESNSLAVLKFIFVKVKFYFTCYCFSFTSLKRITMDIGVAECI